MLDISFLYNQMLSHERMMLRILIAYSIRSSPSSIADPYEFFSIPAFTNVEYVSLQLFFDLYTTIIYNMKRECVSE